MSQSASLNLETVYGQLLAEHSPYTRIIQRDLARTFPGVEMFKQEGGDGQKAMEHVLTAYSLYDSLVGYCQGLAFLVGPLLMNVISNHRPSCPLLTLFSCFILSRCPNNKLSASL
jgi:phytoene/squalene synthetase